MESSLQLMPEPVAEDAWFEDCPTVLILRRHDGRLAFPDAVDPVPPEPVVEEQAGPVRDREAMPGMGTDIVLLFLATAGMSLLALLFTG